MKQLFIFSLAVAALFIAACNDAAEPVNISRATPAPGAPSEPAQPAQQPGVDPHGHTEGADAPRISLADAKKAFDDRSAVFIDTHLKNAYDDGHIPGAINIPVAELELKINTIPKGKKIIAYCS
jgi:3-mercaptopyruvate sulfurtransferase SseA